MELEFDVPTYFQAILVSNLHVTRKQTTLLWDIQLQHALGGCFFKWGAATAVAAHFIWLRGPYSEFIIFFIIAYTLLKFCIQIENVILRHFCSRQFYDLTHIHFVFKYIFWFFKNYRSRSILTVEQCGFRNRNQQALLYNSPKVDFWI